MKVKDTTLRRVDILKQDSDRMRLCLRKIASSSTELGLEQSD